MLEYTFEALPTDLKIESVTDGFNVSGDSQLQVPAHFTWEGSVTKVVDGKYYMIYSAPETGVHPFNNAWVYGHVHV